jgi:hypothetical protein
MNYSPAQSNSDHPPFLTAAADTEFTTSRLSKGRFTNYCFLLSASQSNLNNCDRDSLNQINQMIENFKQANSRVPDCSLDGTVVKMLENLAQMPISEKTTKLCRSFAPFIEIRLKQVIQNFA